MIDRFSAPLLRAVGLAAMLALGGCTGGAGMAPNPSPAAGDAGELAPIWVYDCETLYVVAHMEDRAVRLSLPERTLLLPQVLAASGTRYSDGTVTFWSKGREALVETPEWRVTGCRGQPAANVWEAAALRGVDFRAIGQEPGWLLEIERDRRIVLLADYGTVRVVTPAPPPETDRQARRTIYHARTEAHDVDVVIEDRPCQDVMSGEAFPATVTVRLNGKAYQGCGRSLQ